MRVWKLHALGNNFVFVLHDPAVDYPALAVALCRRDVSVGADGLLSLDLDATPPVVRMWNPDGTADFCGNGLCCAALLAWHLRRGPVTLLDTPGVPVPVRLAPIDAGVARVAIRIPRPTFDPAAIPLAVRHAAATARGWRIAAGDRSFELFACSNGNMHSLVLGDALPDAATFARYSPLIETHPLFPHRTNVLWGVVGPDSLTLRIWERGVGETAACGTGAAAAVASCAHAGHALPPVVAVAMPGGTAWVTAGADDTEFATVATLVFAGALIAAPAKPVDIGPIDGPVHAVPL